MGSQQSAYAHPPSCKRKKADDREDLLAEREQEEAIAQFPYVEFTGRDSITCLTCQGTGYIPTEQVNELVALIPHSDQRLRPQRTKQYVLLSVLLCLLASGLVVFFLFPHSVLVDDDGIKVVKVTFNEQDSLVILAITATLKIRNSNFYSVAVTSLSSQVQYMNTVVGSYVTTNISLIPPRSEHLLLLQVTRYPGAQHSGLHANFSEDFLHWPHDPELLGDTSLCGLWSKFHSCLETAHGSSMAAPVRRDTASVSGT
ncbi:transmembrane protein 106C isoform X1 [Neophocaena asiaeorientalis asiaeorientalis]|uniref:Transmembrane protein 106C isoform X1 n=2 Tax=Phocoenidae TaxID=9740 RepID=A0A341ASJ8_NEOAA|nr:transmembrane protein 106C isoform X1 [Neophocaena asiaeorientalis asiaeorientalis]XP_024592915.1 transmembrane protein 106C isoform X1 [Neophocaena asiaeorientalis asiaeorientalis]XP_032502746.1 transmembrane protein 106C isoform X1 [Phocoena sinus]XP_032502747.1 transmembrane protein 106C isoform X1 [Phocoena sinus]XP_032502748.1 transmembrane protein 106C isoform X1 [Phocoena sinus]XP_032502749.1 transmembrane protein 106C isoform X1 [Phocoena sinus]